MNRSGSARIYRMVMADHVCPYGLKALDLLRREGYQVEDNHLETRAETDAFKRQQQVDTTPQIFIDGERIGGYDDLRRFLCKAGAADDDTTYQPVIALAAMAALMAAAFSWVADGTIQSVASIERFVAFAMCLLALLKLQDVEGFSLMFLNYDLLARRWVRYASLYPFGEGLAGVLMLANTLHWISVPVALFIGTVGAVSVFKAVYLDRRELKCACVGGSSRVPLGFVSLTENLMMIGMAFVMLSNAAS